MTTTLDMDCSQSNEVSPIKENSQNSRDDGSSGPKYSLNNNEFELMASDSRDVDHAHSPQPSVVDTDFSDEDITLKHKDSSQIEALDKYPPQEIHRVLMPTLLSDVKTIPTEDSVIAKANENKAFNESDAVSIENEILNINIKNNSRRVEEKYDNSGEEENIPGIEKIDAFKIKNNDKKITSTSRLKAKKKDEPEKKDVAAEEDKSSEAAVDDDATSQNNDETTTELSNEEAAADDDDADESEADVEKEVEPTGYHDEEADVVAAEDNKSSEAAPVLDDDATSQNNDETTTDPPSSLHIQRHNGI